MANKKEMDPRYKRTVEMVSDAVEKLKQAGLEISRASIVRQTIKSDPSGRGISESAIRSNTDAREIYTANRTWKARSESKRRSPAPDRKQVLSIGIILKRDESTAYRRHMSHDKQYIVERLLWLEKKYATEAKVWLKKQNGVHKLKEDIQRLQIELKRVKERLRKKEEGNT